MTSTPTTIALADLRAVAEPLRSSVAAKLQAVHTAADATGDQAMINAVNELHSGDGGLGDMEAAYLGLFPADANRPQPMDGGGGKTQNPPPPE